MMPKNISKPILPSREALRTVVKDCSSITIFSPFYTAGGLFLFESMLKEGASIKKIKFNCRLTKHDWIHGSIDPMALLRMCTRFNGQINVNIACNDMLHAKAYYNEKVGLIGSANLTSQGFGNGLEFLLMITDDVLKDVKTWFNYKISSRLDTISRSQLKYFIKQNIDEVEQERMKIRKVPKRKIAISSYMPVNFFIDYCASFNNPIAEEVVLRFMGKDQLSGHVKNFYYASYQFFAKKKKLIRPLADMSLKDFRLQETPYKDTWIKFICSPAIKDIPSVGYYAKSTLNYLPQRVGGRQTSGGAGIGNLNKVLPLVAKFIIDSQ
jgi:HKD family nuclease